MKTNIHVRIGFAFISVYLSILPFIIYIPDRHTHTHTKVLLKVSFFNMFNIHLPMLFIYFCVSSGMRQMNMLMNVVKILPHFFLHLSYISIQILS